MSTELVCAAPLVYSPGRPKKAPFGSEGAPLVYLSSNENPLGPSPLAAHAFSRCALDLHSYPDTEAHDLRERYASGHGLRPDEVCIGAGSTALIYQIVRLFGATGSVLVPPHTFIAYACAAQDAGFPLVQAPSLEAIASSVTEHTRLVCIANPNNPTGHFLPIAKLATQLAQIPSRVIVLLDEAYIEYADTTGASGLQLLRSFPNLLILRTFSKVYGLAALRVGLCAGNAALISALERGRPPFSVNAPAQAAAIAALGDTEHLLRSVAMNTQGRADLTQALRARGIAVAESQGNFVCAEIGQALRVWEALLKQGFAVRRLDPYGLHNHLRITVGTPEQQQRLLCALDSVR